MNTAGNSSKVVIDGQHGINIADIGGTTNGIVNIVQDSNESPQNTANGTDHVTVNDFGEIL